MIITGKKFSKPDLSRVINHDVVLKKAPKKIPKTRLDLLLVEQYPDYPRATLQKFITSGFVTVDGKLVTKPNSRYEKGVKLALSLPDPETNTKLIPTVIYEDEHVLVLNKPSGLLSMAKGAYCNELTLADYGILVHRLDRATSGVVILAKDETTAKLLRKQFQNRTVHKTYCAITEGHPKLDEAIINLPLARDLKRPTTFRVDPSGKPAETYYRVLQKSPKYSLIELKPKTGRTHQLRVHLKHLGTPILGDPVYGSAQSSKASKPKKSIQTKPKTKPPRLFLHATSLEITIPKGNRQTFSAPLPPEFQATLNIDTAAKSTKTQKA